MPRRPLFSTTLIRCLALFKSLHSAQEAIRLKHGKE